MEINKIIDGVGKDAEIVTNENGGKQSKSPMAMHLIDPVFLRRIINELSLRTSSVGKQRVLNTMYKLSSFMGEYTRVTLFEAIAYLSNYNEVLGKIATVLQEGAERYEPNNWRLIPQEEHINHALIHLYAAYLDDTQDNHIDHALCRIMMAYATEPSKGFSYTQYIKKVS